MTQTAFLTCIASALLGLATGCGGALLDKAQPLHVRYFAPALAAPGQAGGPPAQTLRLGRIEGSDHLRERIAYRASQHEVGYHEALRWTEQPATYLRRALGRALFESGRFAHAVGGVATTLEAELVAFEDLRDRKAVAVEARVLLHDGRNVLLEKTIRVEEPRNGDDPPAVVEALSRALQKCVAQITTEVESAPASASRSASVPAP